jgi:hypothetical protein
VSASAARLAPMVGAAELARLVAALRAAGLDQWTVADHQPEAQPLMTVQQAGRPGYVWLRPHFTAQFAQAQLHIDDAIGVIELFAYERRAAAADPDAFATVEEALVLWERLRHAWELSC